MKQVNSTTANIPAALTEPLLAWYRENARDLPWRHTEDPYRIWVSEIMLQQTRVAAVLGYYARFLEAFPTVETLAEADEERLMKPGESDSFKVQLHFQWFVCIRKEPEEQYAPFRYIVEAFCLDNIQTFTRRYITLEAALLHCLNGFNENANRPNRYKSIEQYLTQSKTL